MFVFVFLNELYKLTIQPGGYKTPPGAPHVGHLLTSPGLFGAAHPESAAWRGSPRAQSPCLAKGQGLVGC